MSEHSRKDPTTTSSISLGGHLAGVADRIRRHLFLAAARPARSFYEVGRLVQDVTQKRARYGDGAVARIADALGIHVSVLYKCQKVAVAFSPAEYRKLCAKRTPAGLPVFTWSHLEVLAAERDARRRSTLVDEVEEEHLSVRELREEKRAVAAPQDQPTPRCTPTYIREVQELNRQADALARHEDWALVLQKITDATPETIPLLRTALDLQRRIRVESDTIIGLIQGALERAEHERTPPSAPGNSADSPLRH